MLIGEFKTPGPIPFANGMTVRQAIRAAGGFTERAETSAVKLSRAGKGWAGTLDGMRALDDDPFQNITLRPGDSLVVESRQIASTAASASTAAEPSGSPARPEAGPSDTHRDGTSVIHTAAGSGIPTAEASDTRNAEAPDTQENGARVAPPAAGSSTKASDPTRSERTRSESKQAEASGIDPGRVAILGEVANPGLFQYRPVMLKEALAAAGGLKKSADRGGIAIYRGGLDVADLKRAHRIRYDLNRVDKSPSDDIPLLPGDVVQIPLHRRKDFFSQVSGTFNHIAQQVPHLVGAAARPLLTAINPAAGLILNALTPAHPSPGGIAGMTGTERSGRAADDQRPLTPFAAALMKAISSEAPDVQQRILAQVRASLETAR
jgi:protein involved in polysaccharide export with SLBB domain